MPKKSLSERFDLVKHNEDKPDPMIGRVFSDWTVLEYVGSRQGRLYKCQCSCGYIGITYGIELRMGRSKSCGHNGSTYKHGNKRRKKVSIDEKSVEAEKIARQNYFLSHPRADRKDYPPEYRVWMGIRDRCNNPNAKYYENYGGRGIKVCERWNSFDDFLADMGPRPSDEHTIDRINNNGDYEPSNCKWSTRSEQMRNTRRTILVCKDGQTLCVKDWCAKLELQYRTILYRIQNGMSPYAALFGDAS